MTTAIKVRCSACHSLSQVTNQALGAEAMCPFCKEVFAVTHEEPVEQVDPTDRHPLELGKLDAAIAFRLSWEILKANVPILFFSHLVFLGAMVAVDVLQSFAAEAGLSAIVPIIQLVGFPVVFWFNVGLTKVTLQVARGIPTSADTLFSGADRLVRVVTFNLIFIIIVTIGCLAFIVPGVYLMLRFWSGAYFIIDRDCTVSEAFQLASRFSEWNKISSLQLGCLSFGMAVLGLSFFIVGFVVVFPLINFMWTIAYMMMTRQPIQRPIASGV